MFIINYHIYTFVFNLRIIPITNYMSKTCNVIEHNACLVPEHTSQPSVFTSCAEKLLVNGGPDTIAKV